MGNLYSRSTQRTDNNGLAYEEIKEAFGYDKLNRLTQSTTTGGVFGRTQTFAYDAGGLGNLTSRTDMLTGNDANTGNNDVGMLTYGQVRNAGIHAVTAAGGLNYGYDKYGNMTTRGSETITYNVFNKPTRITGTATTDFTYGPDDELFKEVSGGITTYRFAGGIYELIVNGTTTNTIQKSYVDGVILNTRTLTNTTQTANTTQYLHTDHLGSVEATTNALGQFVNRMSFNVWGERQQSDWQPGTPTETFATSNGFTGHDQVDQHKLIHLSGRVLDPNLGRFLSADLFVSDPYSATSYNRYSYVSNNPLSKTDPTGYLEMSWYMNNADLRTQINSWATTASYVNTQPKTTWEEVNGVYVLTAHGVDLSTVNSVSASSILQAQGSNTRDYERWAALDIPKFQPDGVYSNSNNNSGQTYGASDFADTLWSAFNSLPPQFGPGEVKLGALAVGYVAKETKNIIGATGKIGEQALKTLGGKPQAYFRTSLGGRYIDQLVGNAAHESKVGYQALTSTIKRQIAKDSELLRADRVESVTWNFYTSPVTGKGGPSAPLSNALQNAGFNIIVH